MRSLRLNVRADAPHQERGHLCACQNCGHRFPFETEKQRVERIRAQRGVRAGDRP